MEDEGAMDHRSGISSTHGAWTHVALTWRSTDGRVQLFVDGRRVATMRRAQVALHQRRSRANANTPLAGENTAVWRHTGAGP